MNQTEKDLKDRLELFAGDQFQPKVKKLNPAVPHEIPLHELTRANQPWPASPRRKLSMIVPHMVQAGYYANRR